MMSAADLGKMVRVGSVQISATNTGVRMENHVKDVERYCSRYTAIELLILHSMYIIYIKSKY